MSEGIFDIAKLAAKYHEGQTRKYTGEPYINHPARVAARFMTMDFNFVESLEACIVCAFLHDVLEDCDVTSEQLLDDISYICDFDLPGVDPFDVVATIEYLTNPSKEHSHLPRAERKKMDREHLAKAPNMVKLIKIVDRIDNLRDLKSNCPDEKFVKKYFRESLMMYREVFEKETDAELEQELYKLLGTVLDKEEMEA